MNKTRFFLYIILSITDSLQLQLYFNGNSFGNKRYRCNGGSLYAVENRRINPLCSFQIHYLHFYVQSDPDSSDTDGSFTKANSNSFLSQYEILSIARENKYLGKSFDFIMNLYVVCTLMSTHNIPLLCRRSKRIFLNYRDLLPGLASCITKTRTYSNILKNSPPKTESFQIKF